eukprot:jgi/Botrbrau1/19972/Bobra.0059s0087.1
MPPPLNLLANHTLEMMEIEDMLSIPTTTVSPHLLPRWQWGKPGAMIRGGVGRTHLQQDQRRIWSYARADHDGVTNKLPRKRTGRSERGGEKVGRRRRRRVAWMLIGMRTHLLHSPALRVEWAWREHRALNLRESSAHTSARDWHRANVKRRVAGRPRLSELDFERLLQDSAELSSISGSDTESDSGDDGTSHRRHGAQVRSSSSSPRVCFLAPDGRPFAVWRALLTPAARGEEGGATPQNPKQALLEVRRRRGPWLVLLSAGGHFAGAVFDPNPNPNAGQRTSGPNHAVPSLPLLAHKTFHRYVVRAKAGGRQATKDASGKFAKSAGSQLRRHNEAGLFREIQETLKGWAAHLAGAAFIFVHAPGVTNSGAIFSGDPAPLERTDPRLRPIPFTTRRWRGVRGLRPTLAEAKRVMQNLVTVYQVAELSPTAAGEGGGGGSAGQATVSAEPKQATHVAAKQASVAAALLQAPLLEDPPVHRAAKSGDADKVARLLEEGADPGERDGRGRPPYDVAGCKEVRDAFRRAMAAHPTRWDWVAAGVPSALTPDLEALQAARQAEKKAKLKEKEKERKKRAAAKKKEKAAEAKAAAAAEVVAAAEAAAASHPSAKTGKAAQQAEEAAAWKREKLAAAAEVKSRGPFNFGARRRGITESQPVPRQTQQQWGLQASEAVGPRCSERLKPVRQAVPQRRGHRGTVALICMAGLALLLSFQPYRNRPARASPAK